MDNLTSSASTPEAINITLILANLGTPEQLSAKYVARFLREFLSDQRVIELPKWLWRILLNMVVIPLRTKRVLHAYESIWRNDSPMREILQNQSQMLEHRLMNRVSNVKVTVIPAMSYGSPSIDQALAKAASNNSEHVVVIPLFPQYSATSSAPVYDKVFKYFLKQRDLPTISLLKDYYDHPLYIKALADTIRRTQAVKGVPQKLLMSFHGIPKQYSERGDPYAKRCKKTACLLARELGLADDQWSIGFQSRFGKQEWEKPYTSDVLTTWGKQGVESVQVISPAFSADCLETLEELAVENKDLFIENGGKTFDYIEALNTEQGHLDLLEALSLALILGQAGTVVPHRLQHP